MIKVSVLVPVYNTKKYLDKCLESIINQTYRNLEIIIIDDGSNDGSSELCDKYSKNDKRIKVFHKKHEGVVSARKLAAKNTTGQYVISVDSDDYIELDMIQVLLDLAITNKADVVCSGYIKEKPNESVPKNHHIPSGVYKDSKLNEIYVNLAYSGEFYYAGIMPYICTKLIEKELYVKFQLIVPQDIRTGDDLAVIFPLLLNAKCIVVNNEYKPYHYVKNQNSLCNSFDIKYYERKKILFDYLDNIIEDNDFKSKLSYYKIFCFIEGIKQIFINKKIPLLKKQKILKEKISAFPIENILLNSYMLYTNKKLKIYLNSLKRNRYILLYFVFYFRKFFNIK